MILKIEPRPVYYMHNLPGGSHQLYNTVQNQIHIKISSISLFKQCLPGVMKKKMPQGYTAIQELKPCNCYGVS